MRQTPETVVHTEKQKQTKGLDTQRRRQTHKCKRTDRDREVWNQRQTNRNMGKRQIETWRRTDREADCGVDSLALLCVWVLQCRSLHGESLSFYDTDEWYISIREGLTWHMTDTTNSLLLCHLSLSCLQHAFAVCLCVCVVLMGVCDFDIHSTVHHMKRG